jgi:Bacterial archaeo-eukaryotic release factor family 10
MTTATSDSRLERTIGDLTHGHSTPVVTTCYLDVDGAHRPRLADYLGAFAVLAQQARQRAEVEEPELQTVVADAISILQRWLDDQFQRSRTRGLVLIACPLDLWFRAIELPVRVQDQIVVAHHSHLLQLETILAQAKRYGVAFIDHEKMRVFEYRLGELFEYPALFEGSAPHRDRQHGWNVSSSSSATGDAAARWAPAGTHVDRREVRLTERHLARSAAFLSEHLDQHPVDHLLLCGPTPERERLERALPDRYRSRVAGYISVRVAAPLGEIQAGVATIAQEVEQRDEEAALSELVTAFGTGSAILGLKAVLSALSQGRVKRLLISSGFMSQPGAWCPSCQVLWPAQPACDACGAATEPVDDIVQLAVERAIITGAQCRFVRADQVASAADGIAAITRY